MKKYLVEVEKIFSGLVIFVGLLAMGYTIGFGHSLYKLKPASGVDRFSTKKDSSGYVVTTYYKTVEGFDFIDSTTVYKK